MSLAYTRVLESGLIPDALVRFGIRQLVAQRLRLESRGVEQEEENLNAFVEHMRSSPVALATEAANAQHYEVPSEFFELVLGSRMKYSCAYWPPAVKRLDEAETAMLGLTAERAGIANGHRVLELGCGWGSLSLYLAERFPGTRIVAVSNSSGQKNYIDGEIRKRGLSNLQVMTADMNSFEAQGTFDRVVSVEMFEHMRNWQLLLRRIASGMNADGKLFIHVFTHHRFAYPFLDIDESDWIARHFFTGGMMPSVELLLRFQDDFRLERRWQMDGTHYRKTAKAWLANMDANRDRIARVFKTAYGNQARKFQIHWRVFFMACAAVWGWRGGQEWTVSHYLMGRR